MTALFKRQPFGRAPKSSGSFPPEATDEFPELRRRMDAASSAIGESFHELNSQALLHQARFRRFRVGLLLAAAATAAAGAAQSVVESSPIPGALAAILGLAAAALANIESRTQDGHKYLLSRARAEALRSLYFRYVNGELGDDPAGLERRVAAVQHPGGPS